jgi:hypothetical protein
MTWADLPLLLRVELVLEGDWSRGLRRRLVSSSCAWTCMGSALKTWAERTTRTIQVSRVEDFYEEEWAGH